MECLREKTQTITWNVHLLKTKYLALNSSGLLVNEQNKNLKCRYLLLRKIWLDMNNGKWITWKMEVKKISIEIGGD